jgi:hypothetical protein
MALTIVLLASTVFLSTQNFNAASGVLRVSKTFSTSNDCIGLLAVNELIEFDMMLFISNHHVLF